MLFLIKLGLFIFGILLIFKTDLIPNWKTILNFLSEKFNFLNSTIESIPINSIKNNPNKSKVGLWLLLILVILNILSFLIGTTSQPTEPKNTKEWMEMAEDMVEEMENLDFNQ